MPNFSFPHPARCAVSLCYDDSQPVHPQVVAPALERHGFRGTFYCTITTDPMRNPQRWREVAARGHELGNHTLFHPCHRVPPENFPWLDSAYDLGDYTPARFEDELRVTELVLNLLDGKRERTYGNTCCHHTFGRGEKNVSMDEILKKVGFVAARGPKFGISYPDRPDFNLMQIGQLGGDGRSFEDIRKMIEEARETGGWANMLFHGVGKGSHALYIDEAEHEKLLAWLAQNREMIWTAPAVEIAKHVRAKGDEWRVTGGG
ncbi:MAG TPA: polysaccharide deacetylase family protein [Planctomycetota bacterium]|nr:polysaccharide deacetylase family protein [Planctomycetota bacterium]